MGLTSWGYVYYNGVWFCVKHRTFASLCGCLDGHRRRKVLQPQPDQRFYICQHCFCITPKLVQFAPYWSVAFIPNGIDILGRYVCEDCHRSLTRKTYAAYVRHRFRLTVPASLRSFCDFYERVWQRWRSLQHMSASTQNPKGGDCDVSKDCKGAKGNSRR